MSVKGFLRFFFPVVCLAVAARNPLRAQAVGATFGDVIQLGGTPSDIVLDEPRQRLYLVSTNSNRVNIYSIPNKQVTGFYQVGLGPLAAAISTDGSRLYVANNTASSVSVVNLNTDQVISSITLPAKPQGLEVGGDGRVLVTTQGTGTSSLTNTLLLIDLSQQATQQVQAVQFPPPPPTPATLPQLFVGRPTTTFLGKLKRTTPDGSYIVGMSSINNNAQTILFVYEVSSASILRSRTVTGQSTVLSMAPDGSRFMAGFTMYDTGTLAVIGQQNTANAPFPISGSFNTTVNVGGSSFSPDGSTLYSAFNTAATSSPPPAPQSSTLLISDPTNLALKLGIKMPESIVAKMVMTSDGADAWGLSESGLIHLPLSQLYTYPILQPETNTVFLANDDCNRGIASAKLKINNLGQGKLTFSVPSAGSALIAQADSGMVPSTITFTVEPGRINVARQAGTNLYSGNNGTALNINLVSPEAINIPNTIRVYMNYRNSDQRGIVFPVPTTLTATAGLQDMVVDNARGLVYITNAGFNRIEVFNIAQQRFVDPIPVGQLPHQMAMGTDGNTLYVANTGGESISIVDLNAGVVKGQVQFPPIPRSGTAAPIYPNAIALGAYGLQVIMSNGTQWQVINNQAVVRQTSTATPTTIASPQTMLATPDNSYIFTLGGTGQGYLYDASVDNYTTSLQLFTTPLQSYWGVLAAGPAGSYFIANGLTLNSSLTVIGGAQRPGTTTTAAPTTPGTAPVTTVVSAGQRNVASAAALDANTFIRLTTPVRQTVATVTRDDARTTMEMIDVNTGAETLVGPVPENPPNTVLGSARVNVPPRQLVVDNNGNSYAITLSGMSLIPLTTATNITPAVTTGTRGIVNSADGTQNFHPGSFVTLNGTNLAASAKASQLPVPTVLGGSCVTFSDIPLQLLQTSSGQISAQLPDSITPGTYVVQVRSLATAQESNSLTVTVKP